MVRLGRYHHRSAWTAPRASRALVWAREVPVSGREEGVWEALRPPRGTWGGGGGLGGGSGRRGGVGGGGRLVWRCLGGSDLFRRSRGRRSLGRRDGRRG